jgi:nicotinamidase-related amidase
VAFGDLEHRTDPARAALVVVDVQQDFCAESPRSTPERDSAMIAMAARLNFLIDAARRCRVPVVFVQTIHDVSSDSAQWRSRRGSASAYADELCRPSSGGEEFYEIEPRPGEPVVVKHRYDAFVGTELDELLRRSGRDALIFAGTMTDICVETTLRHAVCLDYLATLANDCCAAATAEAHEATCRRVVGAFGLVASAETIAASWAATDSTTPAPPPARSESSQPATR